MSVSYVAVTKDLEKIATTALLDKEENLLWSDQILGCSFYGWEFSVKLGDLDVGPLSLENEALLKSNFPHSCFLHFKNVFEKIVGMADRKK